MTENTKSILIGAVLAGVAAAVSIVADAATAGQLGAYSAIIGAIAVVVLNVIRKLGPTPTIPTKSLLVGIALVFAAETRAQDCPNGQCPRVREALTAILPAKVQTPAPAAAWPQAMPAVKPTALPAAQPVADTRGPLRRLFARVTGRGR